MPIRTRLAVCLIASALTAAARPATAAAPDEAEALVRKGIELRKDFKDQEALEQFQRAYQLVREPRTLAQIGVAEQALGRWVEAEAHVAAALTASSDGWIAKNRGALEQALVVIRTHLGDLEIITSPKGADVRVDGRDVGRSPFDAPMRARAGSVIVEVRTAGYHPVTRSVAVSADELTRETVTLQRVSLGGTPAPLARANEEPRGPDDDRRQPVSTKPESQGDNDRRTDQGDWRRPVAWALAGGALAFAGGGVAALTVRNDRADSYNKLVDMTGCSGASATMCGSLRSDGNFAGTLAVVGFGVAGAMAIGSAFLFATSPSPHAGSSVALIGCGVRLNQAGIACRLSF